MYFFPEKKNTSKSFDSLIQPPNIQDTTVAVTGTDPSVSQFSQVGNFRSKFCFFLLLLVVSPRALESTSSVTAPARGWCKKWENYAERKKKQTEKQKKICRNWFGGWKIIKRPQKSTHKWLKVVRSWRVRGKRLTENSALTCKFVVSFREKVGYQRQQHNLFKILLYYI